MILELCKGGARVLVTPGSDAETAWRAKGYRPKGESAPKAAAPEPDPEPEPEPGPEMPPVSGTINRRKRRR